MVTYMAQKVTKNNTDIISKLVDELLSHLQRHLQNSGVLYKFTSKITLKYPIYHEYSDMVLGCGD